MRENTGVEKQIISGTFFSLLFYKNIMFLSLVILTYFTVGYMAALESLAIFVCFILVIQAYFFWIDKIGILAIDDTALWFGNAKVDPELVTVIKRKTMGGNRYSYNAIEFGVTENGLTKFYYVLDKPRFIIKVNAGKPNTLDLLFERFRQLHDKWQRE